MEKPIIDDTFILKKGEGKGAWTFVEMPILTNVPKKRNSTVRVRGFIDSHELKDFNIWAMKKGTFLAVKADIRKAIKKEQGDSVKIVLYLDEAPMVIPEDFLVCLKEEPKLHKKFMAFDDKRKKEISDWIFAATVDEEIVRRIGKALEHLENEKVKLS
ncbi:DUF1905 domain-containing protein [Flavobacterium sp. MAH-1]|uniref:DUF1905 domain-containing protein n=1 Tax=Flavobacterium agri TaxID=2743471 RepID=A0A7Y8Y2I2_9FLAO|nr:YdeI/OmpD-associated family protein [Flavobacterium agri]NUY81203.1 DUF1905 domain-containing protein [Flavobacterium agri]NYA71227.1 DUF1905 domain-containing protein [Flavobacterium agri]